MVKAIQEPLDFPDPGPPAELVWLDLALLSVDDSYQRDASGDKSLRHIRKIAREFSWAWFQPPTVVRRPDGGYVVVDGQHRVEAARLHPGIDRVPCSVVTLPDRSAEASTFIAINGARMTVHAKHLLKARLAAGDSGASEMMRVCAEAGVQIAGNGRLGGLLPGWTQAAGRIEGCIRRFGAAATVAALRALVLAAGERTNQLSQSAIGAAAQLAGEQGAAFSAARLAAAIGGKPVEDWTHEARPLAFGMGGLVKAVATLWRQAYEATPEPVVEAPVVEVVSVPEVVVRDRLPFTPPSRPAPAPKDAPAYRPLRREVPEGFQPDGGLFDLAMGGLRYTDVPARLLNAELIGMNPPPPPVTLEGR